MIDFLRNWVINIVVLVIFIAFLDIILPKSNMKRYINMISGLLIIIVLINPFINLITKDINIEREVFNNTIDLNNSNENLSENLSNMQNQQVINLYKDNLKQEITNLIRNKTKYIISNISIDIEENQDNDDFGKIKSINLSLSDEEAEDDGGEEINIKVANVQRINVEIDKDLSATDETSSKEYETLKGLISDAYRIPKEYILIRKN